MSDLESSLEIFQKAHGLTTKGKLAAMLHLSRLAFEKGLPLNSDSLLTNGKGQVLGLGKSRVQSILKTHGINRVLAEEAGRTSRGSLGYQDEYVSFLNELLAQGMFPDDAALQAVESWWVARVNDFFNAKPFSFKFDTSKSLRGIVRDLLVQAQKRQKEAPGTMYMGAVLQHLVGAKLSLIVPDQEVLHHGFSVSDSVSDRSSDFLVDDVTIHVTTAPGEALMRKCAANIAAGFRPIIITVHARVLAAESLAEDHGIGGRVDVLEIEQFIATSIYEWSKFRTSDRKSTIEKLVVRYNQIIDDCETDPSLKIALG